MRSPPICSSPRCIAAPSGAASARLRLLANGVANSRAARSAVRFGDSLPPSMKPARSAPRRRRVETEAACGDMGSASCGKGSGLPAAPQALECRGGVALGLVVAEQATVVMQAEQQRVDLERELGGVGVGAQMALGHRLRDRLLQLAA